MEVLTVITKYDTIRSEIQGWTHEVISMYRRDKSHIGFTPGPRPMYTPDTIFQALADGWKLLGPPQPFEQSVYNDNNEQTGETHYSWWLTKDKA